MTHETIAQFARLRSLLLWIEDPAWLVHPDGKVLIKNDAAAIETPVPRWILDYVDGKSTELPIRARVHRIEVDGRTRVLAFGLPSPTSIRSDLEYLGLDEDVHVETAEHLVRGFSDEETSLLIGRSIGVVHALIAQVHRLLGVSTRGEIIELVRRTRPSVAPPPIRVRDSVVPPPPTLSLIPGPRPSAIFVLRSVDERIEKAP